MDKPGIFEQPASLKEGETYLLRISGHNGNIPVFRQVKFLSHTACPAVVIVQDARFGIHPCSRDDLFYPAGDLAS
jgi:hypothetical protein